MAENLDGNVNIGTSIDASGAEKGMKQLQRELVSATGKIVKSLESMQSGAATVAGKMSSLFSGMMGKMAATFSVAAIVKFGISSTKAYAESKRSVDALSASLRGAGITSAAAMKDFSDFAEEIQKFSGISKGAILDCIRLAANFGIFGDKAKETVRGAQALSLGLGMDLNSAMMLLVRASEGNTTMLGRYGLAINKTGDKAKDFAKVLSLVNDKFGALAGANADNLITKTDALKESWKSLSAYLGKYLTPALKKVIDLADKAAKSLTFVFGGELSIKDAKEKLEQIKRDMELLERKDKSKWNKFNPNPYELLGKETRMSLNELKKVHAELTKQVEEYERGIAKAAEQTKTAEVAQRQKILLFEQEKSLLEKLNKDAEDVNGKSLNAQSKQVQDYLEKRAQLEKLYGNERIDFYEKEAQRLIDTNKYSAKQVEAIKKGMQEARKNEERVFADSWQKAMELMAQDSKKMSEIIKTGLNSLMNGFEDMGEALANGENGFKAYAKSAVIALAEIISALATQIQAKSVAALLDKDYGTFGQGMASAAALKVTAGVIKAMAGKFAGGGIVPRVSGLSSSGDRHIAAVNPGELILNEAQQGNLYRALAAVSDLINKVTNFNGGSGLSSASSAVEVKVINNVGAGVTVSQDNSDSGRTVDILIEKKVGDFLGSPKGASVMSAVYGICRQGVRNA
jgi:hypothetical protein